MSSRHGRRARPTSPFTSPTWVTTIANSSSAWATRKPLLCQCPTIDDQFAAGHIRRVVRSQIQDSSDDLVDSSHAAQRHTLQALLQDLRVGHGTVQHVSIDRAGMDGITPDLVSGVLACRYFAEDAHRPLTGSVGGLLMQRLPDTGYGGDVHNGPATGAAQRWDGVFGAQKDPFGIDSHNAVPFLCRAFFNRHARDNDPSIIDQDIELAIALHSHLDGMVPVLFIRDVQMHIHGCTTAGANLCFDLLALRIADIAKHDFGAFSGEGFGLCCPLPPRPTT